MEGIREKVRQEPPLSVSDPLNVTNETQRCTVSDASDHSIQPDRLELLHKRLHTDPVVTEEHHRLFSARMCDIHHLLCKLCHFPALKCLKILKFFGRHAVSIVHIALVDNKLRAEPIAHFLFKLL